MKNLRLNSQNYYETKTKKYKVMAAATSAIVGAAAAAGSLYISAKQASDGAKQAKEAKKALENYNRQKLENPYADLRVSKLGADLAREEAARNYANSVSAIQASGLTGLSILPQLTAAQNTMNRQIGADLDRQFVQNENLKAQGRNVVMNMQEQREIADLAGLGQQMYAGQQNMYSGLQNVSNSLAYTGSMVQQWDSLYGGGVKPITGTVDRDNSNFGTGATITRVNGNYGEGFTSPTVQNQPLNGGWPGVPFPFMPKYPYPTNQQGMFNPYPYR